MKIALIGASGGVGGSVLSEALVRGHEVTGLCRNPDRLAPASGLTAKRLDLYARPALREALADHDVVVSCYGPGHGYDASRNTYKEVVEATVRIIEAVKAQSKPRLVFVGGAGSLLTETGVALVDSEGYPETTFTRAPPVFLQWLSTLSEMPYDPNKALGPADIAGPDYVPAFARSFLLMEHDRSFDWSFFSPPPAMVPGERRGVYTCGDAHIPIVNGQYASISIADAAAALLDEIERPLRSWTHWTAYYES